MNGLTQKQQQVLDAIDTLTENGVGPRMKELLDYLGDTKSNTHQHLEALQKKGFVHKEKVGEERIKIVYFTRYQLKQ